MIFIASVLYILLLPRLYVGYFSDDALYVLAAQSLLSGRYVDLQLPHQPPLNDPLPGYPLFLGPFVKILAPHWSWLKITSVILTLISLFLIWKLFEGWLSPWARLIVVTLYALNPMTAYFSGAVLSEPCFIFFMLCAFIVMRRLLSDKAKNIAWILGILLGWVSLIRPLGLSLILSIALGLAYARQWATLQRTLIVALAIWGSWIARNIFLTQQFTGYSRLWWPGLLQLSNHPGHWIWHCGIIIKTMISENLLGLPLLNQGPPVLVKVGFIYAAGILILLGLFSFSKRLTIPPAIVLTIFTFCFSYGLIHSLWPEMDVRYFIVLTPMITAFLLEGMAFSCQKLNFTHKPLFSLCILIIGWYLIQDGTLIYQTYFDVNRQRNDLPIMTCRWIKENTHSEDRFFTNKTEVLRLYASRYTFLALNLENKEIFRYWLLANDIKFVMLLPEKFLDARVTRQMDHAQKWIFSSPEAFRFSYMNPIEGTVIFQVLPSSQYKKAYESYLVAVEYCKRGFLKQGLIKLTEALRHYPKLTEALNAYGATCLLMNHDLGLAKMRLTKAIQIRPDFTIALMNLSRLYKRMGQPNLAKKYLREALKSVHHSDSSSTLLSSIEHEAAGL